MRSPRLTSPTRSSAGPTRTSPIPYFPAYFNYIVGASKATGGPISGISTPDKYTIVFHLTGPYGTFFVGALSLPLSAPVPKEFAAPLDAKKPTQYGDKYEVATGPYMLKADAKGNFLGIGYQPGKSATLVRNPNWKAEHRPPSGVSGWDQHQHRRRYRT